MSPLPLTNGCSDIMCLGVFTRVAALLRASHHRSQAQLLAYCASCAGSELQYGLFVQDIGCLSLLIVALGASPNPLASYAPGVLTSGVCPSFVATVRCSNTRGHERPPLTCRNYDSRSALAGVVCRNDGGGDSAFRFNYLILLARRLGGLCFASKLVATMTLVAFRPLEGLDTIFPG